MGFTAHCIKKAIKKYGRENFKKEILKQCDSYDDLVKEEENLVNEIFILNRNNYNIKTGGSIGILSKESRLKISETLKLHHKNGKKFRNYDNLTKEQKEKISEGLRKYWSFNIHPCKGKKKKDTTPWKDKIPWNKNKKGVQIITKEIKDKISKTLKNRYKNQEHHLKGYKYENTECFKGREPWNKGKKAEFYLCPHCQKQIAGASNAKRWHFDNCKKRVIN